MRSNHYTTVGATRFSTVELHERNPQEKTAVKRAYIVWSINGFILEVSLAARLSLPCPRKYRHVSDAVGVYAPVQ